MSSPLCIIFNKSLLEGSVPTQWRKAHITAVYKKGHRKSSGNYRPIRLTSDGCKVKESSIRDHIVKFMESNDLFNCNQHGFRKGHSCITQLLDIVSWTEILDEGSSIDR